MKTRVGSVPERRIAFRIAWLITAILIVTACGGLTGPQRAEHLALQGHVILPASFLPEDHDRAGVMAATRVWLLASNGEALAHVAPSATGAFSFDEVPALVDGQRLVAVTGSGAAAFSLTADLGPLVPENGTVTVNVTLESSLRTEIALDERASAAYAAAAEAVMAASLPEGVAPVESSDLREGDLLFAMHDSSSAVGEVSTGGALHTQALPGCEGWWDPATSLRAACVPDLVVATYEPDPFRVLSRRNQVIPGSAIAPKLTAGERRVAMRQDPYASPFGTTKMTFYSNGEIRTIYLGLTATSSEAGAPGNVVVTNGVVTDDALASTDPAAAGYQIPIETLAAAYEPGPSGYTGDFAIFSAHLLTKYTSASLAAYARGVITADGLVRRAANDRMNDPGAIPAQIGGAADSGAGATPPTGTPTPLLPTDAFEKALISQATVLQRPDLDTEGVLELVVWNATAGMQAFWVEGSIETSWPLTFVAQRDGATVYRTSIPRTLTGDARGLVSVGFSLDDEDKSAGYTVRFPELPTFELVRVAAGTGGTARVDGNHWVVSGEVVLHGTVRAVNPYNPADEIGLAIFLQSLGGAEIERIALEPSVDGSRAVALSIDTRTFFDGDAMPDGYHDIVVRTYGRTGEFSAYGPVTLLVQNVGAEPVDTGLTIAAVTVEATGRTHTDLDSVIAVQPVDGVANVTFAIDVTAESTGICGLTIFGRRYSYESDPDYSGIADAPIRFTDGCVPAGTTGRRHIDFDVRLYGANHDGSTLWYFIFGTTWDASVARLTQNEAIFDIAP